MMSVYLYNKQRNMRTYLRTYPVKERKNDYLVKGVTLKQLTNSIDYTMKKVRWGVVERKPISFGIYEEKCEWVKDGVRELGEFIYE